MSRDTQFQGFAKLLTDELVQQTPLGISDEVEKIIARRAYDLVEHTLEHAETIAFDRLSIDEHVERLIPDMTKLPKEQEMQSMYFVDNGDCHGAQALERLEPPKEQE